MSTPNEPSEPEEPKIPMPEESQSTSSPPAAAVHGVEESGRVRPSTGAFQFDGDWPGLFIRGDHAIDLAARIRMLQAHFTGLDLTPHDRLFEAAGLYPRRLLSDDEVKRYLEMLGKLANLVERDVIVDERGS